MNGAFESLESRQLMSVSVTNIGGTLHIQGSNDPTYGDQVHVSYDWFRTMIRVQNHDTATGRPDRPITVLAFGVREIQIDLGDGDDTATIDRNVKLPATFRGGDGNDTLSAGGGRTMLDGGEGDDVLRGGKNYDTLYGRGGNDVLDGASGGDVMSGGYDDDTVTYEGRDENLRIYLSGRAESGRAGERDRIMTDVENVTGGERDDIMVGSRYANTLRGGPGDDRIDGGAGDDHLEGEDGDDRITGGRGADVLMGGNGSDWLDARDRDHQDVIYGKDSSNPYDGYDRAMIDRLWYGDDQAYGVDQV
jgi:Ca2+-binding RTX toxin-like protein